MPGGRHDHARPWDPREDALIRSLTQEMGCRWATLVGHFERRTIASLRNRYQRLHPAEAGRNRCTLCGALKRGHTCRGPAPDGPVGRRRPGRLPDEGAPRATPERRAAEDAPPSAPSGADSEPEPEPEPEASLDGCLSLDLTPDDPAADDDAGVAPPPPPDDPASPTTCRRPPCVTVEQIATARHFGFEFT